MTLAVIRTTWEVTVTHHAAPTVTINQQYHECYVLQAKLYPHFQLKFDIIFVNCKFKTKEGERLKVSWQRDKVLRVAHKDLFVAAGGKFGEKSFVVLTSESLNILCPSLVTLFSRYNTPSNTLQLYSLTVIFQAGTLMAKPAQ